MPILEIDGVGRVEVGPEFLKLSPEQQHATVGEIVSSVQPQRGSVSVKPFSAQERQPNVVEDMAKAAPSGLAKGVIDLAGLPDTVSQLWAAGGDKVLDTMESVLGLPRGWADETKGFIRQGRAQGAMSGLPSAKGIRQTVEQNITGPLYEPKTLPGKFTGAVAEQIPGAGRRLITQALMPGLASEAAGQATEGTAYEPWARGAAAVAGGLAGAPFARASSADQAIRNSVSGKVDPQIIQRADDLVREAANRGVTLTWAEALEQIAPGTGLTGLQRVVESTREGRNVLQPVMANRPAQIDAAARQTFESVAPPNSNPSGIGRSVGESAEGVVDGVRGTINRASDPFYKAAENIRLTPDEMARVRALPGYEEASRMVRETPQLNRYVSHLPDDSWGFLNEVKKQLDASQAGSRGPLAQNPNMQIPAGYGSDAAAVRQTMLDSSRRTPGNPGEVALNVQAELRQRYLQPALDGPLGKLADRDQTTRKAIDALFPQRPLPNSEQEIEMAVRAIKNRNPLAAADLVRAYVESVFDQTAKNIQGGGNPYGGASFAAAMSGQNRANLKAAVEGLDRGGEQVWRGFEKFLEIAEATGKRQREGSPTASRLTDLKDLSSGNLVGNAVKTGASPSKWLTVVSDAWSRWQLGGNIDEIARILVDPASRNRLRAIASMPDGAGQAVTLAGQLTRMASQGMTNSGGGSENPRQKNSGGKGNQ